MAETIAVLNQKGGVGKTITTFNLANYYAEKGFKVLSVDMDPQGNLSEAFSNNETEFDLTMGDFFLGKPLKVYQVRENVDIIPADISFSGVENKIINVFAREQILRNILSSVIDNYDICLIDCPPALNIMTVNSLNAAQWVLIPMKPSSFSYIGLSQMMEYVMEVRTKLNPKLTILGIVLTFFDGNRVVSKGTLDKLEEDELLGGVFNSRIRPSEAIVRAEEERKSIFEYDAKSKVAQDYKELAEEIKVKIKL